MLNNMLLSAATAAVLMGTLYPLMREAINGEKISVGPPYFNLTFVPLMCRCCRSCRRAACWPGSAPTSGR